MIKYVLSGVIFATLPMASMAQSTDNMIEQMKADRDLGREFSSIQRDPQRAIQRYFNRAFRLDAEGKVTKASVEDSAARLKASQRARRMGTLLGYDLDGDGTISAEELVQMKPHLRSNQKAELRMLQLTGDLNEDGDLQFQEVLAFVSKQVKSRPFSKISTRQDRVILLMDVNGDGVTEPQEIAASIDAIKNAEPVQRSSTFQKLKRKTNP